jgi:hypothetical protein
MPTILRQDGFRFFFYSREGNEPPHIHVVGHDGEMKVWLNTLTVAKVFNLSPSHQKLVMEIVSQNRDLLIKKWGEFHG